MAVASSASVVSRASSFNRIVPLISNRFSGKMRHGFFLFSFEFLVFAVVWCINSLRRLIVQLSDELFCWIEMNCDGIILISLSFLGRILFQYEIYLSLKVELAEFLL